jgi:hypothetical protein
MRHTRRNDRVAARLRAELIYTWWSREKGLAGCGTSLMEVLMKYLASLSYGIVVSLLLSTGVALTSAAPARIVSGWVDGNQGRGNHGRGAAEEEYSNGRGEHGRNHSGKEQLRVVFTAHDREVIANYFREYPSQLPPGLAKRGGNLPPGLEKQLREGGTLPPGLQKRLSPCPVALERQLPPLPYGYSRKMLGTEMLILDSANVIRDIMVLTK